MLQFFIFVVSASLGAGLFWSFMPMVIAHSIDMLFPFGYEPLSDSFAFRAFLVTCVATIGPLSLLASIQTGRRMHFEAVDGRPSLLRWAGTGGDAQRIYTRRMVGSLLVATASGISATITAWAVARKFFWAPPQILVLYAYLAFILGLVAAIEFNDLRRTAKLSALSLGA